MQKILPALKNSFTEHKKLAIALVSVAAVAAFLLIWLGSRIKTVLITCDGETQTVNTVLQSPVNVLNSVGIELESDDLLKTKGFDTYGFFGDFDSDGASISVLRGIEVEIEADSLCYHVTVAEGDTVLEAIETSGLTVREDDFLNVAESSTVSNGEYIKLTRVDYITTTEEETIPRGQTYRGTSLVKNGKTVLLSYGKNGTMLKTYQQKIVDGVMEEKELISEEVIKQATNDLFVIGDGSIISPLDYGYEIVNGTPTSYVKVFENVRATGYYAPYGAGTATGRLAQVGYVAVDPKIIPYGTKLWIVAHSRKGFVYGYALAADTGGAMLSGKNFVDLYYETYYECVLNGLRYVDVYVLE